jgi:hypothetical protein
LLRNAFATGARAAFDKFGIAGQPTLSSVGMAPSVTRGLPPAAKPLKPQSFGLGNPMSGGMPATPTELLPPVAKTVPKFGAEEARPELCTSCRKAKHYGPCAKVHGTPGDGVPLKEDPSFIRTKLRGD